MRSHRRILAAIHRYRYRRRFVRVLRSYGFEHPTKHEIDQAFDFELDKGWTR